MKRSIEEQKSALEYSLTNRRPSESTALDIEILRQAAKAFGNTLIDTCPDGRYKALAITALEESLMWAVKAAVLDEDTV